MYIETYLSCELVNKLLHDIAVNCSLCTQMIIYTIIYDILKSCHSKISPIVHYDQ